MRLSELFERYRVDVIVFRNQSIRTEEQHLQTLKSLQAFLGSDIAVSDLKFELVRRWKQCMVDRGYSSETVRGYIIKLRVVLDYASKAGIDTLSPGLVPVPQRSDKVPVCITKEEVTRLIDCTARVKNKAIIALLYASGIRISELCSLDIADLHNMSFTVMGKGSRARLCFYDERAKFYINEYLKQRTDNNPGLFLNDGGKRITPGAIQDTFKTARKKAGIPHCSPHTLRHSFATELLKTNTNLRYVQEFLGHRSIQTTTLYTHVVNEDLREIYTKHHLV